MKSEGNRTESYELIGKGFVMLCLISPVDRASDRSRHSPHLGHESNHPVIGDVAAEYDEAA